MDKFNSSFTAVNKYKVKVAAERLLKCVAVTRKEAYERVVKDWMKPCEKGVWLWKKTVAKTREEVEKAIELYISSGASYDSDISYYQYGGEFWVKRANDLIAAVKVAAEDNIYLSLEDVKVVSEYYKEG